MGTGHRKSLVAMKRIKQTSLFFFFLTLHDLACGVTFINAIATSNRHQSLTTLTVAVENGQYV